MPKSKSISLNLGAENTNLSLYAQVLRYDGSNITDLLDTGFVEIGNGFYIWDYITTSD